MQSKKKYWIITSLIIISIITICIVGYINVISKVSEEFKESEPKRHALQLAKTNSKLTDEIGKIIYIDSLKTDKKEKGQFQLKLNFNGIDFGHNSVELEVPIIGNNGKATLFVVADKKDDMWVYETINAKIFDTDSIINLKPNEKL